MSDPLLPTMDSPGFASIPGFSVYREGDPAHRPDEIGKGGNGMLSPSELAAYGPGGQFSGGPPTGGLSPAPSPVGLSVTGNGGTAGDTGAGPSPAGKALATGAQAFGKSLATPRAAPNLNVSMGGGSGAAPQKDAFDVIFGSHPGATAMPSQAPLAATAPPVAPQQYNINAGLQPSFAAVSDRRAKTAVRPADAALRRFLDALGKG